MRPTPATSHRRFLALAALPAVVLLGTACGRTADAPTSHSPVVPQNVNFTGTLIPAGFATHALQASISGRLTARFTGGNELFFILADTTAPCAPPWSATGCRPLARPPSAGNAELTYTVVRGTTYTFAVWQFPETSGSQPYRLDVDIQ